METEIVNMGDLKTRQASGELLCLGLGSCVAVALYDAVKRIGAMAHVMLPERPKTEHFYQSGKFADLALAAMVEKMIQLGSDLHDIQASLVGGANMFPHLVTDPFLDIGQRNVATLKRELDRFQIELAEEETGGFVGRAVSMDVSNGKISFTINSELSAEDL